MHLETRTHLVYLHFIMMITEESKCGVDINSIEAMAEYFKFLYNTSVMQLQGYMDFTNEAHILMTGLFVIILNPTRGFIIGIAKVFANL